MQHSIQTLDAKAASGDQHILGAISLDRGIQTVNTGIVTPERCVAAPSPPLVRKRGACASAAQGHDGRMTPD